MQRVILVLAIAVPIGLSPPCLGAAAADGNRDLDELFGIPAERRPAAPEPVWRPGHATVIWVDDTAPTSRLLEFDPTTGTRRVLLDEADLASARSRRGGSAPTLDGLVWRPDGNELLVVSGDTALLWNLTERALRTLDTGPGAEEHAEFSPDGRRIAWVRGNDLWVYDLELGREIRLTDDGSDAVFNGVFDWVYTEELAGRNGRAFTWSPDSRSILWLRLDDGEIPIFHIVDSMGVHTRLDEQRYPKPGDPSPEPSLHLAIFGDGPAPAIRDVARFEAPVPYVPRFGFTPDGDAWYQTLDRDQSTLVLVVADPSAASHTTRLIESDPFWVEPVDGFRFLADGGLLWLSRAGGHMHLVRVAPDGARVDLTPGPWEVTGIVGVDPDERSVWVEMARPGPRERRLYRIEISSGAIVELTSRPGTHTGSLAPSGSRVLVRSSSAGIPPRWRVMNGDGSHGAEVPVELPMPAIDLAAHRFVEIEASDGVALHAMVLLPPDLDESRRHPAVVYTYGGPHAQLVRDRWPETGWLFGHVLAGRGFVVFAIDPRGSAGRGRAFEGAVDGALGSSQLPDLLAGVRWLSTRPWVDPDRIGIWGWSYGGYMTSYALTRAPSVFAAGAAVAPVTDWRLYDSIYTERYMDLPEANPTGYTAASVLDAVASLVDPLLVIHGTGEDNVHLQHSLQLADRAWRTGRRFDLVLYPGLGHGLDVPGSRLHVFRTIVEFFEEYLSAGAPGSEE